VAETAGAVDSWTDSIGGYVASYVTAKPIFVASSAKANNKPIIEFATGTLDQLVSNLSIGDPHTIFLVAYKEVNSVQESYHLGTQSASEIRFRRTTGFNRIREYFPTTDRQAYLGGFDGELEIWSVAFDHSANTSYDHITSPTDGLHALKFSGGAVVAKVASNLIIGSVRPSSFAAFVSITDVIVYNSLLSIPQIESIHVAINNHYSIV
jgi:hypothetical protein